MAQRRLVEFVDDLVGGSADETLSFGLDESLYELDLSAGNADALRKALAPYVVAGRRARPLTSVRALRPGADGGVDSPRFAKWALACGVPVNRRGRIPAHVRRAYEADSAG